jgi:hypothetical protein
LVRHVDEPAAIATIDPWRNAQEQPLQSRSGQTTRTAPYVVEGNPVITKIIAVSVTKR